MRIVKYWNKLPASAVTAPSLSIFKKRFEKNLDRSLSPLTDHSSPESINPLLPPARRPSLNVTQTPVLSVWFLHAPCGLPFTVVTHNHVYLGALVYSSLFPVKVESALVTREHPLLPPKWNIIQTRMSY